MNNPLKIVILSSCLEEDIWLINRIAAVASIEGIVLPPGLRFKEFGLFQVLKKTIKRSGPLEAMNQSLMYVYRHIFENRKDKAEMKKIFSDESYERIEKEGVDILYVEDINAQEVRDFIVSKSPDLIVASGTSILQRHILEAAKCGIINLHPGLAPEYRGRYGSYWPVYNREPELVGVTVHFVDSGIDTGAILAQGCVEYNWNDYVKTITYKQHKLGGELVVKCLTDFDRLAANAYHKKDCASKNYRTMGLLQYLEAKRWIRKNRRGQVINKKNES
jgi:folate-dependent phosphoribosylglycinamide formyltransferase PurN